MKRTEILFAPWAIRALANARGPKWYKLVKEIAARPETDLDSLALQLVLVRLNSCLSCDAHKYTERRGCAHCAVTNLGFSKETEASLLTRYRAARKEIAQTLAARDEDTLARAA